MFIIWGVPSLLSSGYRGYSGRVAKLTTNLYLVSGMMELYLHSDIVLNNLPYL
jgi:hypothetical protein